MDTGKDSCGGLYKAEFVEGPQNMYDGSGKTINAGTIERVFSVVSFVSHCQQASRNCGVATEFRSMQK
jgi:hypothetical protein